MNFHYKYNRISPWWRFIRQEFELIIAHREETGICGYIYDDKKVSLDIYGEIVIKPAFYWGASGPTIDTKSSRRGSCVHDALFYLSDKGVFQGNSSKIILGRANKLIYNMCIEDGMFYWRAKGWYKALQFASGSAWEANL